MTRKEIREKLAAQLPFSNKGKSGKQITAPVLTVGGGRAASVASDIVGHGCAKLFGATDYLTAGDLFQGIFSFGETGSGKTSGLKTVADAILRKGWGGLVLAAKADEPAEITAWVKAAGREEDLVLIGPGEMAHVNIFESEMISDVEGGGVSKIENVVLAMLEAAKVLNSGGMKSGNSEFFEKAMSQLLRSMLTIICEQENGALHIDKVYAFMHGLTTFAAMYKAGPEALEDWKNRDRARFYNTLEETHRTKSADDANIRASCEYITREYITLAPETLTSINATLSGLIDLLRREPLRTILCSDTTVPLESVRLGKIFVISSELAVKEAGEIGRMAQILVKRTFQRTVERILRGRPVFLWADECQFFMSPYDTLFQSTARSSRCCTVYATQNMPLLADQLGGGDVARGKVEAIASNLTTKILFLNADPATNEWCSKLIGKKIRKTKTGGTSSQQMSFGMGSVSSGWSEQEAFDCREMEFHRLRNGGPKNKFFVDAILFKTGRTWVGNKRWKRVSFHQKSLGKNLHFFERFLKKGNIVGMV